MREQAAAPRAGGSGTIGTAARRLRVTSVRTGLILWSVGVMALVLTALGLILLWSVRLHLQDLVDRDLRIRGYAWSDGFTRFAEQSPAPLPGTGRGPRQGRSMGANRDRAARASSRAARGPQTRTSPSTAHDPFDRSRPRMLNLFGHPLFPPFQDRAWDYGAAQQAAHGRTVFTTIEESDGPVRIFSMPTRVHGRIVAVTQAAYSLVEMERDIHGVARMLLTLIPLALVIVGFSAAFLTRRLLLPVRQVGESAARINAADLSERLPVTGGDEFAGLSRTLNAMLARIEQSYEQQRRFAADASHELRTPLTALKAQAGMALCAEKTPAEYRRTLQSLDRSASQMARVVDDLLLLARSDAGQLLPERRSFSLAEVVSTAAESVESASPPGRAPIDVRVSPGLRVLGDSGHLIRLFTNLLENAARHTPPEGEITVETAVEGGRARAAVRDTGCGIAPEHLPHLCERFYRVDEARARKHGGTGLGLAISRSIVEAHGGELKIESEPGTGTTVTVRLPLAPDSSPARQPTEPHVDSAASSPASVVPSPALSPH